MKKLITLLLALGFGMAVMTPTTSQARDNRRPSYWQPCGYCGGPLYRQHVVLARDHRGNAIKSWQVLPHHCRSSHGYNRPSYGYGHHYHPNHGSRIGFSFPSFRLGIGR